MIQAHPLVTLVSLGPRILRAETAAIAGLARLQGAGCGIVTVTPKQSTDGSYMSNPGDADSTPITSVRQLAEYIAVGCKPPERFRIGTEHEKFGFRLPDLTPPPYLPADGHPGAIRDLLESLARTGGEPTRLRHSDHGNLIGLRQGEAVDLARAGRPARAVRRAARHPA